MHLILYTIPGLSSGGIGSLTFIRIRPRVSVVLNTVLILYRPKILLISSLRPFTYGIFAVDSGLLSSSSSSLYFLSPVCVGPCISSQILWGIHCISAPPTHDVIHPSRGVGPTSGHVLSSSEFSLSWLWPAFHGRSGRGDICRCGFSFCTLWFSVFHPHPSSLLHQGMGVGCLFPAQL